MSPNLRSIRIPTLAVMAGIALTALAVTGGAAASASPVARASQTCNPPKYPGQGYFTGKIRVTNISCSYAQEVRRRVLQLPHEERQVAGRQVHDQGVGLQLHREGESIATEIDSRVTCRRGTQRIVHTYQQNLE